MSELKSRKNKAFQIGILIIALITFAPLLKIGIVTADDLFMSLMHNCNYWGNAYLSASNQGRFFFLITSYFFYVPYVFDSIIWTRFLQFLPIIIIFLGFNKLISNYFNNKKSGLIFLLIYFIFFQLTANYNAFISYHFYFTTAFAALVWGFFCYQFYYENFKKKYLYTSYLLFTFGLLFYEANILYSLFFFLIAYSQTKKEDLRFIKRIKKAIFLFRGYIVIIVVYMTLMISWSVYHPSQYDGNQFSGNFSLQIYLDTVLKLINGALPLNNFFGNFKFFIHTSEDVSGFKPELFMFSSSLSVSNYIKLLLIPIIFIPLLKISKKLSFSKLYYGMINGLLLIVLPAMFLALSSKYMAYRMEHYTITVFQFFGSTLFFMCLFLWIDKKLINKLKIRMFSRGIILFFLLYSSLAHDYANNLYASDLNQSDGRLKFIDKFMTTEYYDNIEYQTTIYAPSLWYSHSYEARGVTEQGFNWPLYSSLKYKKDKTILRNKDEFHAVFNSDSLNKNGTYFYSLILKQAYQTNDFMLIATKIDKSQYNNEKFVSDTLDLFIYTNNNKCIITYNTFPYPTDSNTMNKFNYRHLTKDSLNKEMWQSRVIDKKIDIQSVNISFLD
ncbi:MAG: hypothetical protein ACOYO1_07510 [Bacteroidales bacterium]